MTKSRTRTEWPLWFGNLLLWVQTQEEQLEREEQGVFQCQGSSCALVNGICDIYALLCTRTAVCQAGGAEHLPKGAAETKQAQQGLTELCRNLSSAISAEITTLGIPSCGPFWIFPWGLLCLASAPRLSQGRSAVPNAEFLTPRTRLTRDFPLLPLLILFVILTL